MRSPNTAARATVVARPGPRNTRYVAVRHGISAIAAAATAVAILTAAPAGTGAATTTETSYSIFEQGPPALQGVLFGTSTIRGSGLLESVGGGTNASQGTVHARGGRVYRRGGVRLSSRRRPVVAQPGPSPARKQRVI